MSLYLLGSSLRVSTDRHNELRQPLSESWLCGSAGAGVGEQRQVGGELRTSIGRTPATHSRGWLFLPALAILCSGNRIGIASVVLFTDITVSNVPGAALR